MKRAASGVVLGLALVAVGAFALRAPRHAFACSGPPTHQQIAMAAVVVEGRVVAVEDDPAASNRIFRAVNIQLLVTSGLRGATTGETLAVQARVPTGAVPVMCPQWDRDETFLGKFVVAGLFGEPGGTPVLDRWGTAYLGLDPGSPEYSDASRIARVAAGAAEGPKLVVTVARRECGAPATVYGSGFQPGRVLLNYPGSFIPEGGHTSVVVGDDGKFVHSFRIPADWCPFDGFVEAYAWRDDQQIGGWPLSLARLSATAAGPLPPDVGNGPGAPSGPAAGKWMLLAGILGAAAAASLRVARR